MAQQDRDHEQVANRLEKETDELEQRSQELGREIEDTRTDWHSKQANPGVPGAVQPSDAAGSEQPGDETSSEEAGHETASVEPGDETASVEPGDETASEAPAAEDDSGRAAS